MDERQRSAPAAASGPRGPAPASAAVDTGRSLADSSPTDVERGRLAPLVIFLERLSAPETRAALAWALLAAGLLWDLVILAAPLVPAAVSWPVYLAGHFMCHQDPARSFWMDGRPLPLCARCTGLHLSAPIGMIAVLALVWRAGATRAAGTADEATADEARRRPSEEPAAEPVRRWRVALVIAALPTILSVLIEWAGGPTSGASRCATAAPLGAAGGALMIVVMLGLDGGSHEARLLHLSSRTGPGGTGPTGDRGRPPGGGTAVNGTR